MGSTRRAFTPEYKEQSVAFVIDGGRSVAEVARNIGVHEMTLSKWASMIQGEARLVTDRVVPVFGVGVWFAFSRRVAVLPGVLGAAPAPTAPGWPPFRVAGTGWLVRRALAGRRAAASRPGMPPSRARCG